MRAASSATRSRRPRRSVTGEGFKLASGEPSRSSHGWLLRFLKRYRRRPGCGGLARHLCPLIVDPQGPDDRRAAGLCRGRLRQRGALEVADKGDVLVVIGCRPPHEQRSLYAGCFDFGDRHRHLVAPGSASPGPFPPDGLGARGEACEAARPALARPAPHLRKLGGAAPGVAVRAEGVAGPLDTDDGQAIRPPRPEHLRAAAAALDGVLAPTAVAPPSASDSASAKSTARRQQADGRCRLSTVLSTPHRAVYLGVVVVRFGGEPSGTRTRDPLIKRQFQSQPAR